MKRETLIFSLPAVPDLDEPETYWWHVVDGAIVASGADSHWLEIASLGASANERPKRIALATAAQVRLEFSEPLDDAATPRQAATIARLAAVDASLGDPATLHIVSSGAINGADQVVTAIVDNGVMLAWLDWAAKLGADPDHVIPVAALLPFNGQWTEAILGSERVIGRHGLVMPLEAGLVDRIVGDAEVGRLADDEVASALVLAAEKPPLDLRSGRFARRRRIVIDRNRIRELVILAAIVPLLTLAWSIVSILQLESATGRLDAETLAVAEAALGRPVTLETAEAELTQRLGRSAHGGLMPPLTALYQALQAEEGVSATEIGYRSDGTLSTTLAAPAVDAINRVLVALQRNGYRITAVPRQAPDGRAMVDATVRSGP